MWLWHVLMKIMSEISKRIEPKLSLPERIAKRWSIAKRWLGDSNQFPVTPRTLRRKE
jgi:hypothetical protein